MNITSTKQFQVARNMDMAKRSFSSPCPDWEWGLPNLLVNECEGGLFASGYSDKCMNVIIHPPPLVPMIIHLTRQNIFIFIGPCIITYEFLNVTNEIQLLKTLLLSLLYMFPARTLEIYFSLTSALDGGGWSTPRPGRFIPGNDPVPIVGGP